MVWVTFVPALSPIAGSHPMMLRAWPEGDGRQAGRICLAEQLRPVPARPTAHRQMLGEKSPPHQHINLSHYKFGFLFTEAESNLN